ncbi:MAG: prephenate dehydrogenase [Gammaproteobacteria bacterium]|jgi:prephenate dehydrogenase
MIKRLCIIGVGLIGGSLARVLRREGACEEIVGASRQRANLERAVELGVIDRYYTDLEAAVSGADMIVVCTPMGVMESVFRAIMPNLAPDAVITDAGSVKQTVVDAAKRAFGEVPPFLVPGHPIAGTEHSGVDASFDTLYEGRRVIITPTESTSPQALERVSQMWRIAGASVDYMEPSHHDEVLAATSHLPHLLAYSLVGMLGHMQENREIFRYAAGGFRDFSRIASSDPQMWHDICLDNKDAIVGAIERYRDTLDVLIEEITNGDSEHLFARFARAKAIRDHHTASEEDSLGST